MVGWQNICKGPDSKYFRFYSPCDPCNRYLTLPLWCESSHKQCVNKCAWMCSNKTLFTKIDSGPKLAQRLLFANNSWSDGKVDHEVTVVEAKVHGDSLYYFLYFYIYLRIPMIKNKVVGHLGGSVS